MYEPLKEKYIYIYICEKEKYFIHTNTHTHTHISYSPCPTLSRPPSLPPEKDGPMSYSTSSDSKHSVPHNTSSNTTSGI